MSEIQTNQEKIEAEAKRQYEHQIRTQLTDEQRLGMVEHLRGIFCFGCGALWVDGHCPKDCTPDFPDLHLYTKVPE